MKIRTVALLAISVPACLGAANSSDAPLAVYYSFDVSPPAAFFTEMQSELRRILAPAAITVTWRSLDAPRNDSENFPGLIVLRLRGNCSLDSVSDDIERTADWGGLTLADTQMVDGRVLSFGAVDCDTVSRFIAPIARGSGADRNALLGRAIARVTAHEIYHMLTGSIAHASEGIARASHSRADLTASTFTFAKAETDWLRAWVDHQGARQIAVTESLHSAPALAKPDSYSPFAPLSFGGR